MSTRKKVFLHYEAKGCETYSKGIFLRENESSVAEVMQTFTKSFHLDHPACQLGALQLTDASGNLFSPSDDLYSLLRNKEDCYVVAKKKKAAATISKDAPVATAKQESLLPPPPLATKPSVTASIAAASSLTSGVVGSRDYYQLMATLDDLIAQKSLRKARDICLDILSASEYRDDTRALERLCDISFQCKKYEQVVRYGEQALAGFSAAQERSKSMQEKDKKDKKKKSAAAASSPPVLLLRVLLLVGRSQSELDGAEEEALESAMQGLQLLRHMASVSSTSLSSPLPASLLAPSSSLSSGGGTRCSSSSVLEAGTATLVPLTMPKATPPAVIAQQKELITLELDFKADLTSRLFQLGRNEEAGAVVNALIGHPSSVSHVLSLLVYAEIAAAYNKVPEAVQGALKAVVLEPDNRRCKALVGKLLGSEAGLQEVYKQVPPVAQAAAAYSFLAGIAKDLSLLDTADTLLRQVVKLDPRKDATHFLSLVHVLEGKLDLSGALNTILLAISAQQRRPEYQDASAPSARFFPGTSVCDWCHEWNDLLSRAIADGEDGGGNKAVACPSSAVCVNTNTQGLYVSFIKTDSDGAGRAVMSNSGKASSGTRQVDGDYAVVRPYSQEQDQKEQDKEDVPEKPDEPYGSNLLDVLALAFTAVKLLFLRGRLGALPPLIRHVEKARRASRQLLHETNIRNEHAYYLCIVQIVACYTQPASLTPSTPSSQFSPFAEANKDAFAFLAKSEGGSEGKCQIQEGQEQGCVSALYVIGDSHVLSSAFSVVSSGGSGSDSGSRRRVLIPKLVTGVKQWHLRAESCFYTKEIFRRTLASVPIGAEVVLLLGEIDCREGLLLAVQRGVYEDVLEAMRATLAIFKQVVQDMIRKKKLKVYIHPLLPVLDVTRQVVQMFNGLYKEAMAGIADCHWLDMERHFVEPSSARAGCGSTPGDGGYVLRESLKLDGTHVHPSYVSLLQAALQEISP